MIRLNIWVPLVFALIAVWMSGLSQAAPQRGGGKVTPSLTVSVSDNTIAAGQEVTGTVSVNAPSATAVVVTLTSSDKTEAKFDVAVDVVKTVTIPIGATNTTFTVIGVNDGTWDGAKAVTITAAATNYKSGSVNVTAASPALLPVRYRVQFIPLLNAASYSHVHDENELHEAVGAYNDALGFRVGYYYDADLEIVKTPKDMIPGLPAVWVNTSFVGINNHGAIVGMVQDKLGFSQCILIYPSAEISGYSFEITSPYGMDSHFTKINDDGDIVGISWDDAGVSSAFAYKPGLAPEDQFTFFGSQGVSFDSVQVTNTRLGIAKVGQELSWFKFLDGQETQTLLPPSSRQVGAVMGLSNDGQIAVTEALAQQKGRNISYQYKPGIMESGAYVWQGNWDDGRAELVNSKVEFNTIGDVVGYNEISRVRWLRHADHPEWGYVDLDAMVRLRTPEDAELWSLIPGGPRVYGMSDRDTTGFGVLTGDYGRPPGYSANCAFVLIPELINPPIAP